MPKLTVLIPCKNEVQHIRGCIESVRPVADEILIADSGSTDGTLEIVQGLGGCRLIEREYVNPADFKNWAISQAQHPWILAIDADERVTAPLAHELNALLASEPTCDGYTLARDSFFLGHAIRHSDLGASRQVRLFRRDSAQYEPRRVHPTLMISSGNIGRLEHSLVHHVAIDLDRFLEKQVRQATWAALDAFDAGKRASWLRLATHAPLRFLQLLILRGGLLDGRAGVIVCGLAAWQTFLKDARLWALRNCRVPGSETATAARTAIIPFPRPPRAAA